MVTYTYEADTGTIHTEITGKVDVRQLMDYLGRVAKDGSIVPGASEVVEVAEESLLQMCSSDAQMLVAALRSLVTGGVLARSTFITHSEVTFGIARMFQMLAEGIGYPVEVVRQPS